MQHSLKEKRYVPYLILLGVLIIPLLYSYFYLGAFWDPYSRLDKVPVAVVNNDTGATINDTSRNLGNEMCDELKKDASLNFTFTDADTAKDGLEGSKYYATITIPSNFSSTIASANDTTKQTATITYSSNEKRNYLASQILNNAVNKIELNIRGSVNEEIVTTLSNQLKDTPDKLQQLKDGLTTLQNGATDLTTGTSTLKDGTATLNDGAAALNEGTSSLKDGATALKNGTDSLQTGATQLLTGSKSLQSGLTTYVSKWDEFVTGLTSAKTGSQSLQENMATFQKGMTTLVNGATQLDNSTNSLATLTNGAASLTAGATSLQQGITSYTAGVNSLLDNVSATTQALATYAQKTGDPTIRQIVANLTSEQTIANLTALKKGSSTLKDGALALTTGTTTLSEGSKNLVALKSGITELKNGLISAQKGSSALAAGTTTLSTGLDTLSTASTQLGKAGTQLRDGATSLNTGIFTLSNGMKDLNTGATTLAKGASDVNDGASSLKDGTTSLLSGATTLYDGTKQLETGITTAKDSVTTSITDANEKLKSLDGLSEYAATPVTIQSDAYAAVPNYGTAFAPYFMSLSLWVGGLMIFFGIYFDPDHKFKLLSRYSDKTIKRTFAYLLIGLLQAILLCIVLIVGLGLSVQNIPLYFLASCLVSMVFIALIQLLLLFFSNIGKFLAIALLILQLTSCGGTFPMETVPKLFNVLFPFMPMTYSVGLFKEAISGTGDASLILYNAGILVGILVVTMGITILFSMVQKNKNNKKNKIIKEELPLPRAY